ncbi:hypothetical protein QVD17_31526 [Tagetes erecta]|uniref:Homeobox domain-containing protein n=1 Tax=Tagetes erecta TaxID=13708 RepID=A0AAD8NPA2_TARER|nr:hypothetical protein QVD17_31526 [Tagetes erecta]
MYNFHSTSTYTISPENHLISPPDNLIFHSPFFESSTDHLSSVSASIQSKINNVDDDASRDSIKEKIASHPLYSKLLDAYINCQKVGAPPEVAYLLDDIRRGNNAHKRNFTASTCLGDDPELDEFMETFWQLLVKYESDLVRPFDEATVFLDNIESQLRSLDIDEGGINDVSSESEVEMDGAEMKQDLKDKLLLKFGGGRISSLKHQFTKKKKKGKLPKEATQTLLDWWKSHNTWPYPTEGDKIWLAETSGLDPKQINNWFINQRKRHWKPSESMQLAFMGSDQCIYDD